MPQTGPSDGFGRCDRSRAVDCRAVAGAGTDGVGVRARCPRCRVSQRPRARRGQPRVRPRAGARYGPDAERVALEQRGHQPALPSLQLQPGTGMAHERAGRTISGGRAPDTNRRRGVSRGFPTAAEDRVRPRDASLSERLVLCRRVAGRLTGGRSVAEPGSTPTNLGTSSSGSTIRLASSCC